MALGGGAESFVALAFATALLGPYGSSGLVAGLGAALALLIGFFVLSFFLISRYLSRVLMPALPQGYFTAPVEEPSEGAARDAVERWRRLTRVLPLLGAGLYSVYAVALGVALGGPELTIGCGIIGAIVTANFHIRLVQLRVDVLLGVAPPKRTSWGFTRSLDRFNQRHASRVQALQVYVFAQALAVLVVLVATFLLLRARPLEEAILAFSLLLGAGILVMGMYWGWSVRRLGWKRGTVASLGKDDAAVVPIPSGKAFLGLDEREIVFENLTNGDLHVALVEGTQEGALHVKVYDHKRTDHLELAHPPQAMLSLPKGSVHLGQVSGPRITCARVICGDATGVAA